MPDRYVIKSFARHRENRLWQYGVDVIVNGELQNLYTLTMDNSNHDMKTKDRDHDVGVCLHLLMMLYPNAHIETHYLN